MPYNNSGYSYRQQAGMGLGQGVRTGGMNNQYYSNNGNPGGAYNQQSNQGRYRPPTIQTPGQNTQWNDSGGYSYNIPNSNGSAGNYFDPNQQNRSQYGRPPIGTRPPQADMTLRGPEGYDPYADNGVRYQAYGQGGYNDGLSIQPVGGPGGTRGDWGYGNDQPLAYIGLAPTGNYGGYNSGEQAPRPVYQRGNGSLRAALDQGRMMEQLRYGGYLDSAGGYGQMQQPPRPEFGNNGPRPPAYGGPGHFLFNGPIPPSYDQSSGAEPTPLDGGGAPNNEARPFAKPAPLDYNPDEARPFAKPSPQPYGGPASTPPVQRPPIPYGGSNQTRPLSGGGTIGGGGGYSPSNFGMRPNSNFGVRVQRV